MAAPEPNYVHRARLASPSEIPVKGDPVHDGDTFWLVLDLGTYSGGVRIAPVVNVRLKGIDTWELSDPQGRGQQARAWAASLLAGAQRITVSTEKPLPLVGTLGATLGRTVAQVWVDGLDLAQLLRDGGHAKDAEHLG